MTRFAAPGAALLPAFESSAAADLRRALTDGGPRLEALILEQQLGPLWHACIDAPAFAPSRATAAMLYMRQAAAQSELDGLFSREGIRYAVFKGAGTRELIHDDPSVRVCYDIDVLVSADQRAAAARALVGAGYRLDVNASLASHEVTLSRDLVAIDLHWDLLRPGRVPAALADQMLARRRRHGARWVLGDTDALFVMLIHPAFSKHLSTLQMGLHRLADLALWVQRVPVDWPTLQDQLRSSGLKTAAWAMLRLMRTLSPASFGERLGDELQSLQPGPARTAYLSAWLDQDLSYRFRHAHAVRLLGLSTMLHDRPSGTWNALRGWHQSRRSRDQNAHVFEGLAR